MSQSTFRMCMAAMIREQLDSEWLDRLSGIGYRGELEELAREFERADFTAEEFRGVHYRTTDALVHIAPILELLAALGMEVDN